MDYSDSGCRNLLLLASCEINILCNDVKTAIDILKNVDSSDTCFEIAKIKLASIYLNQLKQPRAYTRCFEEIVDHSRSKKNLLLLAKAYSNIQEFENSLEIYQ